jgi:hypothetical protein
MIGGKEQQKMTKQIEAASLRPIGVIPATKEAVQGK